MPKKVSLNQPELPPLVLELCENAKPHRIRAESFKVSMTGKLNGHEVILTRHLVRIGPFAE